MATQDKNGKWKMTEANLKQRAEKRAESDRNAIENMARDDIRAVEHPNGNITLTDKKTGRFVKGSKPASTFADRPDDRNSGGWKPEYTPTYQYRRFWNMSRKDFVELCKNWGLIQPKEGEKIEIDESHTVVEESAARRVLAAMASMPEMREITNRVEGMPTTKVEAKVENKYSNLTDEELKALARAEFEE